MHGNIVNVPTNLNIIQFVLPRMPYDDSSIFVFLKRKLEYKSTYMSSYVHPNIMMKALWKYYETFLYTTTNVSIWLNWESLTKVVNANENNQWNFIFLKKWQWFTNFK
jgi:hypothetical protein